MELLALPFSSSQIFFHLLPINVVLENGPLGEACPKGVGLGNYPSHGRGSNCHDARVNSVNHPNHDEDTEQKTGNPEPASHRNAAVNSAAVFQRLPFCQELSCVDIHKAGFVG